MGTRGSASVHRSHYLGCSDRVLTVTHTTYGRHPRVAKTKSLVLEQKGRSIPPRGSRSSRNTRVHALPPNLIGPATQKLLQMPRSDHGHLLVLVSRHKLKVDQDVGEAGAEEEEEREIPKVAQRVVGALQVRLRGRTDADVRGRGRVGRGSSTGVGGAP